MTGAMLDATVVGSGPNGLAAAVTLAKAGLEVRLVERARTVGGGLRTAELTLPGFRHDVCSAVHPQALASPFFSAFGLRERVRFIIPEASYAHPLGGREAAIAYRDLDRTVLELGNDGDAWRRLFGPLLEHLAGVASFTETQLLRVPPHPIDAFRYVRRVLEQGTIAQGWRFRDLAAAALFAGVAAHTPGRHPSLATAGTGLLLGAHAHAGGWGVPVGGSQAIADALADEFRALGGRIDTGVEVRSRADLEPSRVTLLDTSPEFLARFAGETLPAGYRRRLARFKRGPGVAKLDLALMGPVPWTDARVATAPTVHLGGARAEIAAAEREVLRGGPHEGTSGGGLEGGDAGRQPGAAVEELARRHDLLAQREQPSERIVGRLDAEEGASVRVRPVSPGVAGRDAWAPLRRHGVATLATPLGACWLMKPNM